VGIVALVLALGEERPAASASAQATKSESVVKIDARADEPRADGSQLVTFTLDIEKPWHLYANPVPKDFPGIPTAITFEKASPKDVKIEYPAGVLVKDAIVGDYKVYEGKMTIKATVQRAKGDRTPMDVTIQIQACNDKLCLLPAMVKVQVTAKK
jgi:hypothetical protein